MSKEIIKARIIKRMEAMTVPQRRIVYTYSTNMIRISRRRLGIDDIPTDRPAPGQIVKLLSGILDKATARELFCILKFSRDVERHF